MAKLIILRSNEYDEQIVNTDHIVLIRRCSYGGTTIKLDAPYNGTTTTINVDEEYEVIKKKIFKQNKIVRLWQQFTKRQRKVQGAQ